MITIITEKYTCKYKGKIDIFVYDDILRIEYSYKEGGWSTHGMDYYWLDDIKEIIHEKNPHRT